jgi:voltage-gated potassium channel Kch
MNLIWKSFISYIIFCFIFAAILSFLPHNHFNGIEEKNDKGLKRYTNRLYFTFTTISTVGYGDITPASPESKLIVSILMILISFTILQALVEYFDIHVVDKFIRKKESISPA